jgi:hypothetical protein
LDAGANVEAKDKNGLTAAMRAEQNGFADIVKLLNKPRSGSTEENKGDLGEIPCSSIKMKSGDKSKQERFFSAPEKRVKEVLIDAMAGVGFLVKKDEGNKLEAVLKYPELGGGKKSRNEKLVFNLETVDRSGLSAIRVTGETKGGFRLRTYNWTDPVLDQAECLLALFDFRTDEDILAENAARSDSAEEQSRQRLTLPDGTPIKMRLRRYLAANEVKEGDRFSFQVTEDVVIDGIILIKKTAVGWGQVTIAEKSQNFNRAARLNFTIDYVRAVNGQNIPVRDYHEGLGGTSKAKTTATVAANAAAMGGIGILGLALTKGKNVGIRAGTPFIVFSNGDQTLKVKAEPEVNSSQGGEVPEIPLARLLPDF